MRRSWLVEDLFEVLEVSDVMSKSFPGFQKNIDAAESLRTTEMRPDWARNRVETTQKCSKLKLNALIEQKIFGIIVCRIIR